METASHSTQRLSNEEIDNLLKSLLETKVIAPVPKTTPVQPRQRDRTVVSVVIKPLSSDPNIECVNYNTRQHCKTCLGTVVQLKNTQAAVKTILSSVCSCCGLKKSKIYDGLSEADHKAREVNRREEEKAKRKLSLNRAIHTHTRDIKSRVLNIYNTKAIIKDRKHIKRFEDIPVQERQNLVKKLIRHLHDQKLGVREAVGSQCIPLTVNKTCRKNQAFYAIQKKRFRLACAKLNKSEKLKRKEKKWNAKESAPIKTPAPDRYLVKPPKSTLTPLERKNAGEKLPSGYRYHYKNVVTPDGTKERRLVIEKKCRPKRKKDNKKKAFTSTVPPPTAPPKETLIIAPKKAQFPVSAFSKKEKLCLDPRTTHVDIRKHLTKNTLLRTCLDFLKPHQSLASINQKTSLNAIKCAVKARTYPHSVYVDRPQHLLEDYHRSDKYLCALCKQELVTSYTQDDYYEEECCFADAWACSCANEELSYLLEGAPAPSSNTVNEVVGVPASGTEFAIESPSSDPECNGNPCFVLCKTSLFNSFVSHKKCCKTHVP